VDLGLLLQRYIRSKNETQHVDRDTRVNLIVRKRWAFGGAGKASADAYRGLFVRQLSVQHTEGREPSGIRAEAQGDRGDRF
jgi:hypothetical protein